MSFFSACVKMPIEPLEVVAKVMVSPPEQRGVTMLNTVIELWDSPVQPALLAVIRSAIASPDKASLLRQFLQKMLLTNALSDISGSIEDKQLRASLLISQLFGLIAARHVLKLEPIASASVDDLVQWVAPTLQRYLTGNIDD
ncbi:TetR/AcrR family transcriptional regulator [Renibacterium salmoninarum]|nr:TetR/AcrR family transcriptional regulator [Renibacterium salmoninarum]